VFAFAAASLTALAFEGEAAANGRFPAAGMLVAQPNDPSHLVLRATYGLLFSHDSGASWDWLCETPVGYGGAEDPSVVLTGSGAILVGTFKGLTRSTDGGCSWGRDPTLPASIVDLAARPFAPDRVYALSCIYAKAGEAGPLFDSEILVSDDAGEHWASRGRLDPSVLFDSIEVAPSDPKRVYLSGIHPRGKDTTGALLVSNDDGHRWAERRVDFVPSDRGVFIAAVDPHDANLVYVRTSGPEANRLTVTTDAGKTSRVLYSDAALQGFALGDDGASVYVGSAKGGLARAARPAAGEYRFEKRWPKGVQCLTAIGSALWACTPTTTGFVLGASSDEGKTFGPKLTLAGMRGPIRCAAVGAGDASVTSEAQCAPEWASLRTLIEFDAGSPNAAPLADAGAGGRSSERHACGCEAPGGLVDGGQTSLVVGLALGAGLTRRRARGAPRSRSARARRGSPVSA
jgi:photosystem II stability/assembly factor-like uncharacterized protein